ncbi:hypothetical protein [uncultured Cellulomonas sp.]|uniref:hypothetical protein n=1 Tax=uncultured Cellulomonas sp. TaxID=189682 RepID=UPI00262268DD|nr:hypothetical protein [uncultured Cellulomonas sp.]
MTTNDAHGAHAAQGHHVEPATVGTERVVQPAVHEQDVHLHGPTPPTRGDLVRWGPVWAGLVVTLTSFMLLELVFLALGWLSLAQGEPGSTSGWISAVLGFVAFFLGGLTAGATAMWRSVKDGLLHGVLVWALTTVGIIFLTVFGGGALFGAAAEVLTQVSAIQRANVPDADLGAAMDTIQPVLDGAVLGIVLALVAAVLGGAAGGRMWPAKRDVR